MPGACSLVKTSAFLRAMPGDTIYKGLHCGGFHRMPRCKSERVRVSHGLSNFSMTSFYPFLRFHTTTSRYARHAHPIVVHIGIWVTPVLPCCPHVGDWLVYLNPLMERIPRWFHPPVNLPLCICLTFTLRPCLLYPSSCHILARAPLEGQWEDTRSRFGHRWLSLLLPSCLICFWP